MSETPSETLTIDTLFETMSCLPSNESDNLARNWVREHDGFVGFVDNEVIPIPKNLSNDNKVELYEIHAYPATQEIIESAFESSKKGLRAWSTLSGSQRSLHLTRFAQNIENHKELVAQIESLSSLKHLHQTRSTDVSNLIQSFYYNASLSELRDEFMELEEIGVVCVVAAENNGPLLSSSFRLSSILAGGNAVILLVNTESCFSAFLLAELGQLSGLPPGTLNVLPIESKREISNQSCNREIISTDEDQLSKLSPGVLNKSKKEISFPKVDKFIINGSSSRCNMFVKIAAEQNTPCEFSAQSQPAVIVYENADIHSACNSVLETLFFYANNEDSCVKVFVQQSIEKKFHDLLEDKFLKITVGPQFSKTEMSSLVPTSSLGNMESTIKEAKDMQLKVVDLPHSPCAKDLKRCGYSYLTPVLICNVPTTSKIFEKVMKARGPMIITTVFRTVKESIAMFNCNKKFSQVSLWTERIAIGLEVAYKVKTRTVWLNSQNLWDSSVNYGGIQKLGNSVEGGKEGFFNHLGIKKSHGESVQVEAQDITAYGTKAAVDDLVPSIRTEKVLGHHIGGCYTAANSKPRAVKDASKKVNSYVSNGTNSDIHNAVKAALNAQPKWECLSIYRKNQIFRKAAEALLEKKEVFAALLHTLTGEDLAMCKEEVEESASVMRFSSSHGVKTGGEITETIHGKVLLDRNPVGVIGIQCPDQKPLLSFTTLVLSAVSCGNTVAVIPSEKYPVPALKVCEIMYSSGLIGGVVNIVCGGRAYLTRHLCLNLDVDAVWFSVDGGSFVYNSCITHPKRVFDCKEYWPNFMNSWSKKLKFSFEASEMKAIYIPVGSIFAN